MWYKILINIIDKPFAAFGQLRDNYEENEFYKYPWLWLLLIYSLLVIPTYYIMLPQMKQFAPQLARETAEKMSTAGREVDEGEILGGIVKGFNIQGAFMPLNVLFAVLIVAVYLWVYLYFFSYNLTFGKIWIIVMLAYFTQAAGGIVNTIYHVVSDYKFMNSLQDIRSSAIGLQMLLNKETTLPFLYNFLAVNNVLALWNIAILTVGLSVMGKKAFTKTLALVFIPWLILSAGLAMLMNLGV